MYIIRSQVIVVGQRTEPFSTVEPKIGIESWLTVEVQLDSLVTLFDIVFVGCIPCPEFKLIYTSEFLVVIDRKSILRIELLGNLKWYANEIRSSDTSKFFPSLGSICRIGTHHCWKEVVDT